MSLISISVESVVKGHHVFKEVWNAWKGDKFYLQVEEFNHCDRYAVAMVVDDESVGHVPRDVAKLENYDEIRSLYKFFFNELMEADRLFLKKIFILTKLECRIFGKFMVGIDLYHQSTLSAVINAYEPF